VPWWRPRQQGTEGGRRQAHGRESSVTFETAEAATMVLNALQVDAEVRSSRSRALRGAVSSLTHP
jgi:hypothetical protein